MLPARQLRINHGAEHRLDVANLFLGRLIFQKAQHLTLNIDADDAASFTNKLGDFHRIKPVAAT